MNSKLPLPIIKLEDIIPKNEMDKKCAPSISFENGSCIPLKILVKLADAYNIYSGEINNGSKINLYDDIDMIRPDEYKRYLIYELSKHLKMDQNEWIKHKCTEYMKEDAKNELEQIYRPHGPQGKFDWLSTFDINYTLEQYEKKYKDFKFLGAVPIDFESLDYLPFKNLNLDKLYKSGKVRIGVIFNLDEHYKSGSHWVSLFIDLIKGQIYFSDSYGFKPEQRIIDFINKIEKYLINIRKLSNLDIRYNKTRHQRGGSECGVYSINFILRLLKGKSFDHITKKRIYDEKVNKCRNIYFKNIIK